MIVKSLPTISSEVTALTRILRYHHIYRVFLMRILVNTAYCNINDTFTVNLSVACAQQTRDDAFALFRSVVNDLSFCPSDGGVRLATVSCLVSTGDFVVAPVYNRFRKEIFNHSLQ